MRLHAPKTQSHGVGNFLQLQVGQQSQLHDLFLSWGKLFDRLLDPVGDLLAQSPPLRPGDTAETPRAFDAFQRDCPRGHLIFLPPASVDDEIPGHLENPGGGGGGPVIQVCFAAHLEQRLLGQVQRLVRTLHPSQQIFEQTLPVSKHQLLRGFSVPGADGPHELLIRHSPTKYGESGKKV